MDTKSNLLERLSKLNSTYLETKVQLSINTIVLHFQFDLLSKFCPIEKIVPIKYLTGFFEASPVGFDDGRYIDVDTTIQDTPSFFIRLSWSCSSFLCVHFMSVYVRPIKWHCVKTVDNRAGINVTRWEAFLCMAIRQPETSLDR